MRRELHGPSMLVVPVIRYVYITDPLWRLSEYSRGVEACGKTRIYRKIMTLLETGIRFSYVEMCDLGAKPYPVPHLLYNKLVHMVAVQISQET